MTMRTETTPTEPTGETALAVIENLPAEIATADQYRAVTEHGRSFRDLDREIIAWFKPLKEKAASLHKDLVSREKEARAFPVRGLGMAKALLDGFDQRQREAKEKAEREAREARERDEREAQERSRRLEEQAEEQRRIAEAADSAEKESDAEAERDRLAIVAEATAKAADLESAAQSTLDAPRPAAAFVATTEEAPVVAGASKSEGWDFELVLPHKIRLAVIRDAMRVTPVAKLKASWLGTHLRGLVKAHGEQAGGVIGEDAVSLSRKTTRRFS